MLIVVRHGSTKLNGKSGDDKMRGWLNVPLSSDGKRESYQTADKIKQLNVKPSDNQIHSSTLDRAVETASAIGDEIDTPVKPTINLKDWNIGKLEGQDVKKVLPTVHEYLSNPDKVLPGGESYNSFLKRVVPYLKDLVESDSPHIAVTHNRVTTLLKALTKTKGSHLDLDTLKKKGPVDPGGIMAIYPDWTMDILHGKASQED